MLAPSTADDPSVSRAQGTLAAIALALVLVLTVVIIGVAIPSNDGGDDAASVDSDASTVMEGFSTSLDAANKEALSEGWTTTTLGVTPGGDPVAEVRGTFDNSEWSSMQQITQDSLVLNSGEYIQRTELSQSNRGDISDIEFVGGVETRNMASIVGYLDAEGSTAVIASDVSTVDHGMLELHWLSLPSSRASAATIVADSGSGTWEAKAWKSGNRKISFTADGMRTQQFSAEYITVDLVEGKVNGNDVPININDGVFGSTDIRVEGATNEWGGIELLTDGNSPLSPGGYTDPENGDMTRSVDILTSGEFDVTYQSDSTTRTERSTYSYDPSGFIKSGDRVGYAPFPYFEVQIRNVDEPDVANGEDDLTVTARIHNTGNVPDTQTINFEGGAGYTDSQTLSLDDGDSQDITFTWPDASDHPGSHTLRVSSNDDSDTAPANIDDPEAFFAVDIQESNIDLPDVAAGETGLTMPVKITNTGSIDDTQDIIFRTQGTERDRQTISLNAGESTTIDLTWPNAGNGPSNQGEIELIAQSEDDRDSETVVIGIDDEYFAVDAPDKTVEAGETVTIEAAVSNIGTQTGTQTVVYSGPPSGESRQISLDPGSSETFEVEWQTTDSDVGTHDVTFESDDEQDTAVIEVTDGPVPNFDVEITGTNSPVKIGEQVSVDATITNKGNAADTQSITATAGFTSETDSATASLDPGEKIDLSFTFDTTDDDTPGFYTVEVASENDSDQAEVKLRSKQKEVKVVDIATQKPDRVGDDMMFYLEIENVGETTVTESYLELHLLDDGSFIGSTIYTGELEPGESTVVRKPIVWYASDNGWHEYNGMDVTLKAHPAPSSEDNSDWEFVYVPQFPTYELDMVPSDVKVVPDDKNEPVSVVTVLDAEITNTGDLPGDATARFNLLESEDGQSTGEKDQTLVSLGPGETYVIDQYPRGENELKYGPSNGWMDTIKVEVEVEDDRKVHDSATARKSWVRAPPDDSGGPCESGTPEMRVETNPVIQFNRQNVDYDVYLVECEDEEEGTTKKRELSPSEYTVEYAPQSPGPEQYLTLYPSQEEAKGEIPDHISRDRVELGWRVEHHYSDASGYGGAIWEKK